MTHSLRSTLTALVLGGLAAPAFAQPTPAPSSPADDLAKAADATAEVANLPPADPAAPAAAAPATKASSDDIDLSSLGLDPASTATSFDDKLNIYGFADISYSGLHWGKAVPTIEQDSRSFVVGNLNLYLSKNLTPKVRALAEVRFSYLPNGAANPDGTTFSAYAVDVTNSSRLAQWGSSVIERLYVEYDLTDHLTIRAGHWLTPYGIWNIDHGSPAIIAVARPYIIGEQFFPEHQTGLQLFGNHLFGSYKLNYFLTASNGRGADEAQQDLDTNVALGGRLELEAPQGVKLGVSYYEGRYTGFAPAMGAAKPTYREMAYSADALYDHGGLRLQGEISARDKHFEDGARTASAAGFTSDGRDFGFYVLAGYRTTQLWNVMPYTYYEHYRPQERPYFSGVDDFTVGLNFRPASSFVAKLQYTYAAFADGPELLAGTSLTIYAAQAAWMF